MNCAIIMKRTCAFILSAFLVTSFAHAGDIDPNVKPGALPVKEFTFPKYTELNLANGMKVFVIEDTEQPTIAFSAQIKAGSNVDGDKQGTAELLSGLLTKGAGKRNALQLAATMDGLGANIGANASGEQFTVFASGLKKHMPTILEVLSDVMRNPALTQEEFVKSQEQFVASKRSEKSDPGTMAQNLARQVAYGKDHPYAMRSSEESVAQLTLDDLRKFHATYFKPNITTIAVVGDITVAEAKAALEGAFGDWKKGDVPSMKMPEPKPMPKGVYYIERPASVQSTVLLTNLAVPYSSPEYDPLQVASNVIGLGFGGRLFRTLRETYAFTYTPFGFLTSATHANRFAAGADVRNAVTDSTIIVIKRELGDLATNGPAPDELNRIQRFMTGSYLMNFESTQFIAGLLLNAEIKGVSIERAKNYPNTVMSVTPNDVKMLANKYLNPDEMRIVVVGKPEIADQLAKYGPVTRYDLDLSPLKAVQGAGMSWTEFLAKHIEALGGKNAVGNVKTVQLNSNAALQAGPQSLQGTAEVKNTRNAQQATKFVIPGVFEAYNWVDKTNAWQRQGGNPVVSSEGADLDQSVFSALIFPLVDGGNHGFQFDLQGRQNGYYLVKAQGPNGGERLIKVDENTFLINSLEYVQAGPQGEMPVKEVQENYVKVDAGVMMPSKVTVNQGPIVISQTVEYKTNVKFDDSIFRPAE